MNPSTKNSHVEWAELDANILHIICIKLALIFDFIHFRAVCKRWRSATTPSDLPLQFPLLIGSHDGRRDTKLDVFSLQTRKFYTLDVPQIHGKYLVGPSHGYLLAYISGRTPSSSLLNPFTGSQLHLHFTKFKYFSPINLGPNPTKKVGDAIIYMGGPDFKPYGYCSHYVGYWDSEKKKWTAIEVPYGGMARAYYKGRLYLYGHKTHVIDISTGAVLSDIVSPAGVYFATLIVTPGGLLGVHCLFPFGGGESVEKCCFKVYRLVDEDEKPHWIELGDIGDSMIFIGFNKGFCMSASDFDGLKGNCIYFLRSNNKTGHHRRSYVGRYDLGENKSELVACTRSCNVWIVPSLC